jgi:hypothetical protein
MGCNLPHFAVVLVLSGPQSGKSLYDHDLVAYSSPWMLKAARSRVEPSAGDCQTSGLYHGVQQDMRMETPLSDIPRSLPCCLVPLRTLSSLCTTKSRQSMWCQGCGSC